ncbi:uncharacterized protein LOC127808106 [Diospyros lotus]|uniref:uncharacterized protein LOC127808106 n=1 Tax=Diospyros lotus TaxID=55363 RepID=UPI002258C446|nr:uncharacterized protein LOC127808106 [Diospyros lotus]
MASSTMPKQLAQLLQEQQDPFVLELYLLERGYVKNKTLHCYKRRKFIPNCSKIVKTLINKLSFVGDKNKGNSSLREIIKRNKEEPAQSDGRKIAADRRLPWMCRGENEESPVSVLEKLPSKEEEEEQEEEEQEEESPIHHDNIFKETLFGKKRFGMPGSSFQRFVETMALQQPKQLLYDWVREMVETRRAWEEDRRQRRQLLPESLRPEELGKLLFEGMRSWSNLRGNLTNTIQLLNSDFETSGSEWRDYEAEIREIGVEIGDDILEDIIFREILF